MSIFTNKQQTQNGTTRRSKPIILILFYVLGLPFIFGEATAIMVQITTGDQSGLAMLIPAVCAGLIGFVTGIVLSLK